MCFAHAIETSEQVKCRLNASLVGAQWPLFMNYEYLNLIAFGRVDPLKSTFYLDG